tara:strand:+ start:609 stop:1628 length:1020 start_codon:yes stop_codon:yes gene_type:complete
MPTQLGEDAEETSNHPMSETILSCSKERFSLYPIKYDKTFEFYLQAVASFWTVSEVDLTVDIDDFAKLSASEKKFVSTVLAFFAGADAIVNENLAVRFYNEVQIPEARQFYGFQIGIETIHAHMYNLMIETLIADVSERKRLFNAVNEVESIRKKAEWALRWIESSSSFAERLLAFACVEGIFFSASFCAIYFFKKKGKMPGLTFSNELIARDEGLHRDFACHLYSLLDKRLDFSVVKEIITSSVECEKQFVDDALDVGLVGLNAKMMQDYVEFIADHLAVSLQYPKIYNTENPFDWMTLIALQGKTNFFEKRVAEYQKSGVMNSKVAAPKTFSLEDDF